jgi:predicted nucleic acid-binding Zn ribbon protein
MLTYMAKKTCPHCGASIDSSRTVCPNCRIAIQEKSRVTLYLIACGIIVVIILVVAVLLLLPASQPIPLPNPPLTVPPTLAEASAPQAPSCSIAITGKKNPPATIQLQVMTSTCSAGDVTELRVSINGAQKGTLNPNPGSSGMFAGISGSNNVIVTAKFANGVESVVFQNAAL